MRSHAGCRCGGAASPTPRGSARRRKAAEGSRPLPTMQRIKGVVMARLRAGYARPLQGCVNELRAKARPTEYGKVGCRAACPQAAGEVGGNVKPYGSPP